MAQQQPVDTTNWNQPCSDNHLAVISKEISDWREVSPYLGLTETEERDILGANPHSVPAQRIAMMRKWKQKHGAEATYTRLCEVFENLKKTDLVDKIKILSNSCPSKEQGRSLTVYQENLKKVYQTSPTTWLPLPISKHIKLAMTNEKGTRYTREPDKLIKHRVRGEVELLMASKVSVDMDSIFDDGTFENVRPPLVILVEGAFGLGKSTLAYHYCQMWVEGNLSKFDLVALVYLRHPDVHDQKSLDLHKLLLLASNGEEGIENIVKEVVQLVKDGLKCLLILDGWDEAPDWVQAPANLKYPQDNSFLGKLLRSVSSNTTILITSRPDSSVDLHNRPNVKRLEIRGFTKENIHEYFREALSTQVSSTILEDECSELMKYLADHPAIESSCYVPLNAAILVLLYLQRNQPLPTTHFEMFKKLLLRLIVREVNRHDPERILGEISSLDDLPKDLKKQIEQISLVAYEGVKINKVVFTQEELQSILPKEIWEKILNFFSFILPASAISTAAQQDLPAMGVLQRVQWAGRSKKVSYNFFHLSIQEILAAYYITRMGNRQQVTAFKTLRGTPRFNAVLQFFAGFTKLTNRGVCDMLTPHTLSLSDLICYYEAELDDQSLYAKIIERSCGKLSLRNVSLKPLDCMSVGYFLAFALRTRAKVSVDLSRCYINDNALGKLMAEFSKHAEACPEGVLQGIELNISCNKIGDNGITHIAIALQTNTTLRKLDISQCSVSDEGAESLARALAVNNTLQELDISHNDIGDYGITHIATALQTNNTLRILMFDNRDITDEGVLSLSEVLSANSSLEYLKLCWYSEFPYRTLKKIGECVETSGLINLELVINKKKFFTLQSRVATVARVEEEWLQCVEAGGKKLIQSLKIYQKLHLELPRVSPQLDLYQSQVHHALMLTARSRGITYFSPATIEL